MSDIGQMAAYAMGLWFAAAIVIVAVLIGAAFGLGWWLHG